MREADPANPGRTAVRRARRTVGAVRRRCGRWAERLRDTVGMRLAAWEPLGEPAGSVAPRPIRSPRPGERIDLVVESVGALHALLAGPDADRATRHVRVVVQHWQAPYTGWSGRLGPLPHLVHHELTLPGHAPGPAEVTVQLAEPLPVARVVAAVAAALRPGEPLPVPVSAELAGAGPGIGWLRAGASVTGVAGDPAVLRPYDLHLGAGDGADRVPAAARLVTAPAGAGSTGAVVTVLADALAANPRGRRRYGPGLPTGHLRVAADADRWWIERRTDGPTVVAGRVGDPLDERQTAVLHALGQVTCAHPDAPPGAYAAVLAQLAMTGVPLHAPALPAAVAALLDVDLAASLGAAPPGTDALDWELRSVVQRRAALRGHATGFGVPRLAAGAYPTLRRPPTVSALLVTRRPQRVARAVAALAAQDYPELEVVVGLHGVVLPADVRAALAAGRVPVQVVTIPAELSFGEALGEATRCARGSLVTKVDDDDRYGPEHVWDLVLARHYCGATVVGKGAEFVHLEQRNLTVRRRMAAETFTDVVAGGTILLARGDLEAVGGWRPVDRSVDRALLDRVLRAGGLVYRTHGFGFLYTRHADGHTWDPGLDYFVRDAARRWDGFPPYAEFGLERAPA